MFNFTNKTNTTVNAIATINVANKHEGAFGGGNGVKI